MTAPTKVEKTPTPARVRNAQGRLMPAAAAPKPMEAQAGPDMATAPGVRQRVAYGQRSAKLYAAKREGFERRWMNDDPGRVQEKIDAGWTHVMDRHGKPEVRVVDRRAGLKAYLMEIPTAYYNEDQAAKSENLDATEKVIYNPQTNKELGGNIYVPSHTPINVSVQRGRGKG
jgi:hypothetical protein